MICRSCHDPIISGQEIGLGANEGGGIICKECSEAKSWTGILLFSCIVLPLYIIVRIAFVVLYLRGKTGNPSGA